MTNLKDLKQIYLDKKQIVKELKDVYTEYQKMLNEDKFELENLDGFIEKHSELVELLVNNENKTEAAIKEYEQAQADENAATELQQIIASVNEEAKELAKLEAQFKTSMEDYFDRRKDEVKSGRTSSKAAMNYYRMQNNSHFVDPQFYDNKK